MKLGLVTDIHEHVEHLQTAIAHFEQEQVDQIVFIGDAFEMGKRLEQTAQLLSDCRAVGVWGNHDFGLCNEPSESVQRQFSPAMFEFFNSLKPQMEIEDCLFCHVEPWLNANDISEIWYFKKEPTRAEALERSFSVTDRRVIFIGHFHRWLAATPGGPREWDGNTPILLDAPERHFVVIGACCEGRYAVYDTEECLLTPFNA